MTTTPGPDEPTAPATTSEGTDMTTPAETEITGPKPGLLPGFEGADPTTGSGSPTSPPEPVRRTGPSVPTVVWGVLLALVAAAVIAHQVSTVDLNLGLSGPLVLLGAGGALVVWGIAGIGRARRR